MSVIRHNLTKAKKRALRVRSKMTGTANRPRVSVFRSNRYIFIQAIDDVAGKTIASAHTKHVAEDKKAKTKTEKAAATAAKLAAELKKQKVSQAIFDRGSYRYHGRVKSVAETLRSEGIRV